MWETALLRIPPPLLAVDLPGARCAARIGAFPLHSSKPSTTPPSAQAPKGTVAFFHGCSHGGYDHWYTQPACPECRGGSPLLLLLFSAVLSCWRVPMDTDTPNPPAPIAAVQACYALLLLRSCPVRCSLCGCPGLQACQAPPVTPNEAGTNATCEPRPAPCRAVLAAVAH